MKSSEIPSLIPINVDAEIDEIVDGLWQQADEFESDRYASDIEKASGASEAFLIADYIQNLRFDLMAEVASRFIHPEFVSLLPDGYEPTEYFQNEIGNKEKYFALMLCNRVIYSFRENKFAVDVHKMASKIDSFIKDLNYNSGNPSSDHVILAFSYLLGFDKFLKDRGVFITGHRIGDKFSAKADPDQVAELCTQARVEAKMTKVAVAEATGINEKNIRQLEKGERSPSLDTLQRYAQALGYEARIEFVPLDLDNE